MFMETDREKRLAKNIRTLGIVSSVVIAIIIIPLFFNINIVENNILFYGLIIIGCAAAVIYQVKKYPFLLNLDVWKKRKEGLVLPWPFIINALILFVMVNCWVYLYWTGNPLWRMIYYFSWIHIFFTVKYFGKTFEKIYIQLYGRQAGEEEYDMFQYSFAHHAPRYLFSWYILIPILNWLEYLLFSSFSDQFIPTEPFNFFAFSVFFVFIAIQDIVILVRYTNMRVILTKMFPKRV